MASVWIMRHLRGGEVGVRVCEVRGSLHWGPNRFRNLELLTQVVRCCKTEADPYRAISTSSASLHLHCSQHQTAVDRNRPPQRGQAVPRVSQCFTSQRQLISSINLTNTTKWKKGPLSAFLVKGAFAVFRIERDWIKLGLLGPSISP